jgi:hypothetical protein
MADHELLDLYRTPAREWLQKKNLEIFTQDYIAPIVRMCTFSELADISAFDFLHIAMYLTVPVYEFAYNQKQFTDGLEDHIFQARVERIETGNQLNIYTSSGQALTADQLIIAVPPEIAQQLITFQYDKKPKLSVMYHVRGQLKKELISDRLHIFRAPENNLFLWPQSDGSYLCYRMTDDSDFSDLFDGAVDVITKRIWDPAFWMGGTSLLGVQLKPGIFLAGDYNVVGMEDAYISGIAAARACLTASPG